MGLERVELDPAVPVAEQVAEDYGPVTLINRFGVAPELREAFLAAWAQESANMLRQPGCLSVQMYQGVAGSGALVEVATWETSAQLRAALTSEEFARLIAQFPDCTSSPQLLEALGVPGACEGAPLRQPA